MNNYINQDCGCKIINTIKTVDWLVENTSVKTFDKIKFEGYQRQVTTKHVQGIIKYISNSDFYFPTSIICSCDEDFTDESRLYIVDGQHRVEAFREIKNAYKPLYDNIKKKQLSVIVLEKPSISLEVETFITINKTAKKVDTSLALILKNMLNRKCSDDQILHTAKKEYIAVELGIKINEDADSIWFNKIVYEGSLRQNDSAAISLNSFVRSTRILLDYLEKYNIIKLEWKNEDELKILMEKVNLLYLTIWNGVKRRWPELFESHSNLGNIIQGNIGVAAITKYLILQLEELDSKSIGTDELISKFEKWISGIGVSYEKWLSGEQFAGYSSGSGQNLVAHILYDSYVF